MPSQWTIGALPDCDLQVDQPGVSGRHCRLTLDGSGYALEDLRSAAGTFVNGERIRGRVSVTVDDSITLGPTIPMPRPPGLATSKAAVLRIGREPDNDFVIHLPIVSGYHARVSWEGKPGRGVIEDLGSSNGTAVGAVDRKVSRSSFSASETIYFGDHPVPAAELLARVDPSLAPPLLFQGAEMIIGRDPACQHVVDRDTVSGRHARLKRSGGRIFIEDLGSSNGTFVNGRPAVGPTEVNPGDLIGLGREPFRLASGPPSSATRRINPAEVPGLGRPTPTMKLGQNPRPEADTGPESGKIPGQPILPGILLIQAPIVAIVIGLASGAGGVAAVLFWLGLASIWFGLSGGVLGNLPGPDRRRGGPGPVHHSGWPARLGILGMLCVVQCVLARLIVFPVAGLDGPGLPALGLLILGSGVGLAMGVVIVLIAPRPSRSWAALAFALASLWLFGGGPWSLPRSNSLARLASNASPSRWAFEGLLLSGPDRDPRPVAATGPGSTRGPDLAEAYFPAESDRMGPRADAMALGAMLIGLIGAGLFLVKSSRRGPSTLSGVSSGSGGS